MSSQKIAHHSSVLRAGPGRHSVSGVRGLYLYVTPDGQVRRWIFRFTSPATGKVTEKGLGLFPAVSLSAAQDTILTLRKQIAAGICPITARRTERANRTTFKEACEQWIATHKPSWRSASQDRNVNLLLFTHGKALLKHPVKNITPTWSKPR